MKKFLVSFLIVAVTMQLLTFSGCEKKERITVYGIDCEYSDGRLTGKENLNFYNSGENPVSVLKFNLYANAFRKGARYPGVGIDAVAEAYYNGISYGEIIIINVTPCKEYAVVGEDKNVLSVYLSEQVFPEESVSISIEYEITLANVIARTGVNDKTVNLANFYPILCALGNDFYECVYYSKGDPFYSDVANYNVRITVQDGVAVAGSGEIIGENRANGKTTYSFSVKSARSFSMVLSKDYKTVSDNSTGVKIIYYYYNDDNPTASLGFAVESMKLFSEYFGAYPYKTYSVCQTRFLEGGMEYPCLSMISDKLEGLSYGEVIVHETAHQWWQATVGNNEIEHPFLDEGLSEYSVILFYEKYKEFGLTREKLIEYSEDSLRQYCSLYKKLFGKVDTGMGRRINEFGTNYEYVMINYIEPCIMYDTLRKTIGDEKFFTGLKNYFSEYKFKNAVPDDLIGIFERTGADTNGFFESFINGKVVF